MMSKIDDLIKQHCPNGVEYRELGEVAEITDYVANGSFASLRENVTYKDKPDYAVLLRLADYSNGFDESKFIFIDEKAYNFLSKTKMFGGELILSNIGSVGSVFKCPKLKYKMNLAPNTILVKTKNNDFYYHYFLSETFQKDLDKITSKSAMPKFNKTGLKQIKIPVPPLLVQEEIVRVLDAFTALEAELEAELEARKRQYEYYRNKLLTFDENTTRGGKVKFLQLGEVGNICMCKRIMKHQTNKIGGIPFYKIGTFGKSADSFISYEIYEDYKRRYPFPKKGDILISASGTIGKTVVYNGEPAYFQDSNIVWLDNDETQVLNKFLRYLYQKIEWKTEGGTIQRLYNENIRKVIIPIPPIEEQERIVAILDKFDSLVNDITQGIPAEINARRKQYEYYRNKLLTFDEAA